MHFVLVGPGALGCLLARICARGCSHTGDSLTVLDYNRERARLLHGRGIIYEGDGDRETVPVTAVSDPSEMAPAQVLLLCVKSYDVTASLNFCRSLLGPETLVLFLQNGIGHLDLTEELQASPAAFATTTEGATLMAPGHVRHGGSGTTYLGFLQETDSKAHALLDSTGRLFEAGGLHLGETDSIRTRIWAKLLVNVAINALTATLGCLNGELLTIPGVEDRMRLAVGEAAQVARALGIPVMDDPYQAGRIVCHRTSANVSSMLQDVRNRRKTEIEAINGAIVRLGLPLGIATPENLRLTEEVRALEKTYL